MKILKYINSLGDEIKITNSSPFLLEKFEISNSIDIYDNKSVGQDGTRYINNTLDKKDITLEVAIIGSSREEVINYREKINKVFNPKLGQGILLYKDDVKERCIECIINKLPYFSSINFRASRCLITLSAYDPFWKDLIDEGEIISTWIGGWKFKFSLPFRFKQKGEPRKNIFNGGNVETPVQIIFKGPAVNPKVLNYTTGEFIKVDRTLTTDDTLYITTEFGNKKVEIERDEVRINAFNYIDLDSTFFQLKAGDNMIEYSTQNELEPQSVEIRYRNRYLGV